MKYPEMQAKADGMRLAESRAAAGPWQDGEPETCGVYLAECEAEDHAPHFQVLLYRNERWHSALPDFTVLRYARINAPASEEAQETPDSRGDEIDCQSLEWHLEITGETAEALKAVRGEYPMREYGVIVQLPGPAREERQYVTTAYDAADAIEQVRLAMEGERHGIGHPDHPEGRSPKVTRVGPLEYMEKQYGND